MSEFENKPADAREENTREFMQAAGTYMDEHLPQGWGFAVLAFPYKGNPGELNYISSGEREDMPNLIEEWVRRKRVELKNRGAAG